MPESPHNSDVRREMSDASLKWVLGILAAGIVAAVVIHWGTYRLFERYERRIAAERKPGHALAPAAEQPAPPEPRLEQVDRLTGKAPDAVADMAAEQGLNRYGPGDEPGFVRVPVERAIDRLAGRLPVRAAPPAEESRRAGGLLDAGEPNSGRVFRREER
jgi:hypothetical protein